jgi:hypothetical protein
VSIPEKRDAHTRNKNAPFQALSSAAAKIQHDIFFISDGPSHFNTRRCRRVHFILSQLPPWPTDEMDLKAIDLFLERWESMLAVVFA